MPLPNRVSFFYRIVLPCRSASIRVYKSIIQYILISGASPNQPIGFRFFIYALKYYMGLIFLHTPGQFLECIRIGTLTQLSSTDAAHRNHYNITWVPLYIISAGRT